MSIMLVSISGWLDEVHRSGNYVIVYFGVDVETRLEYVYWHASLRSHCVSLS
jgi:hypothetical protein